MIPESFVSIKADKVIGQATLGGGRGGGGGWGGDTENGKLHVLLHCVHSGS